jgi:protein-disulfide isomerase
MERALFERRARVLDGSAAPALDAVLRVADRARENGRARRARAARWSVAGAAVLAAACTLAMVGKVGKARRVDNAAKIDADGESPSAAGATSRGPAQSSIAIVEFAEFECPFCALAEGTLRDLERAHPNDVRVVFKNLPLPMHPGARLAAKAALAADAQGRFWEYHDRLFARTGTGPLDRATLERIAADLQLDAARFSRDLDDPALDERLAQDKAEADAAGVQGTPTFFVNGCRINGAQPIEVFEAAIARKRKN